MIDWVTAVVPCMYAENIFRGRVYSAMLGYWNLREFGRNWATGPILDYVNLATQNRQNLLSYQ